MERLTLVGAAVDNRPSCWEIVTHDRVKVKVCPDKTFEVLSVDDLGPCHIFFSPVHSFGVFNGPVDIPLGEIYLMLRDAADCMAELVCVDCRLSFATATVVQVTKVHGDFLTHAKLLDILTHV